MILTVERTLQNHTNRQRLENVRSAVNNFSNVLDSTRKRLRQADEDLDKLVGARTRAIERKLRSVEAMSHTDFDQDALLTEALYVVNDDEE